MDNERTITYDITCGHPLRMDHEYAHCSTIVQFQGFTKQIEDSTVYLCMGAPLQLMVPLTDDYAVLIVQTYTRKAGTFKCQLLEAKLAENSTDTYEYMRYSDIFHVIVTPSLAAASMVEVTDPRLELVYTQMHEAYQSMLSYEHSAQTYAESASASATTATTKAGEASASATSAASSASTASGAATTATTKASEASASATSAASSASTATTKAAEAASAAETAAEDAAAATVEAVKGSLATKTEVNVLSARMDTFTSLTEGSTTGDAELTDIRVGSDGTTYATAGDAVRGQISDLKEDFTLIEDVVGGVQYFNEVNPDKCTADKRVKPNDGTLFDGATGWSATDYILLKANTTYYYDKLYYEWMAFYSTTDRSFVAAPDVTVTHITDDNYKGTIVVGANDLFFRGSIQTLKVGVSAFVSAVMNVYHAYAPLTIEDKYIDPLTATVTEVKNEVGEAIYANLIDATKITEGYLINKSTGIPGADANWCCTDYILLKANTAYTFNKIYTEGFYAFYSATDKSFVSSPDAKVIRNNVNDNYYGAVEVGASDLYFRGSILKANKAAAFLSSLYGVYKPYEVVSVKEQATHRQCRFKKILIIGDSISAYNYQSYNKWVQALTEEGYFMANVNNNSVHATGYIATLSGNHDDTFGVRLQAVTSPEDYDLVIVFGGVNDYLQNVPMGTSSDDATEYFVPAVEAFYTYLAKNFINARILVVLPMKCYTAYDSNGEPVTNTQGKKLTDYADEITAVAKRYAFPVFDLLNDSGFYPWVSEFKSAWTNSNDGLHPNTNYSKNYLAPLMRNFIDLF